MNTVNQHHLSCRRLHRLSCQFAVAAGLGLAAVLVAGSWNGENSRAIAQACYMVTASGQRISLGNLCGEMAAPLPESVSATPNKPLKRVQPPAQPEQIRTRRSMSSSRRARRHSAERPMIFDTGASNTLITKEMAEALQLRPQGAREVVIADGSTVKFRTTTIETVTTGGMPARKLTVTVADSADIGLLGHDFFHTYDVKIKRNVIEFQPQTD